MKQTEHTFKMCEQAWDIHARMEAEINPAIQSQIYGELLDHRADCPDCTDPRVEHYAKYMASQKERV